MGNVATEAGTKQRRIERKKTATREIIVRLHGWPKEIRMMSVVEACWMVEFVFLKTNGSSTGLQVFVSDDYQKSYQRWLEFCALVEE